MIILPMTKIALFTDTASDINQYPELKDQVKVDGIIHTYINIGEESFTEKDMNQEELLKRMDTDDTAMWPKTSQPSVGDFVEHYEKLKSEGFTDVIFSPCSRRIIRNTKFCKACISRSRGAKCVFS